MAQAAGSVFNKKAEEKLRNPDDLEKYVRVTNPSVWVALVACILLVVGLLSWGVFGTVSKNVSIMGAKVDDQVVCFLDFNEAGRVRVGDDANVGGVQMTVKSIAATPLSSGEAAQLLHSDYLRSTLLQSDWGRVVQFEGDASSLDSNVPFSVTIVTERVAPLSLLFEGR